MSVRTIASGSDLMVFVVSGTAPSLVYKPIAGQTNVQLTQREVNDRETNAKNLGGWVDFFKGLKKWAATVDMDVPDPSDVDTNEVSYDELQAADEAGTKLQLLFTYVTPISDTDDDVEPDTTKPSYTGLALISAPLAAPSGENMTSSVAFRGCRKLTKVAGIPAT